ILVEVDVPHLRLGVVGDPGVVPGLKFGGHESASSSSKSKPRMPAGRSSRRTPYSYPYTSPPVMTPSACPDARTPGLVRTRSPMLNWVVMRHTAFRLMAVWGLKSYMGCSAYLPRKP